MNDNALKHAKTLKGSVIKEQLMRFSRLGALILLALAITSLNPSFLKTSNLINVFRTASPQMIMAFGMTIVMITGGIDLSIGSVVTLTSVVAGYILTQTSLPWPLAILGSIAVGGLCGLATGSLIAVVKLPPAVASYGMLWVARGLSFAIMGAKPFFDFDPGFRFFGKGVALIPVPIWIVIVFAIVFTLLLKFTTLGRGFYALGANPRAARSSGMKVRQIQIWAYVLSGCLAAVAGIILAARLNAVDQDLGAPFLMPAIASPVMGGTSMTGGVGGVGGTIIGALIMIVVANGMNLVGISSLWQQLVIGVVVVLAVWFDLWMKKKT